METCDTNKLRMPQFIYIDAININRFFSFCRSFILSESNGAFLPIKVAVTA